MSEEAIISSMHRDNPKNHYAKMVGPRWETACGHYYKPTDVETWMLPQAKEPITCSTCLRVIKRYAQMKVNEKVRYMKEQSERP